jgi:hypothetical protein
MMLDVFHKDYANLGCFLFFFIILSNVKNAIG